jgi:hypothetical protein
MAFVVRFVSNSVYTISKMFTAILVDVQHLCFTPKKSFALDYLGSQGSSVTWTPGRSKFDPLHRQVIFPLTSVSRLALGPTQPPIQWVLGVLSPGLKRGCGVMLTTRSHLVPRSRMGRSYTSSPPKRPRSVLWDSFSFRLFDIR